jgi:hypothetical protein
MPLAGRMKLKTFLLLLVGGVVVCGGGSLFTMGTIGTVAILDVASKKTDPPTSSARKKPSASTGAGSASKSTRAEVDKLLLGSGRRSLTGKKEKDIASGKPYKVNLYQDDGHQTVNRAKVDLDRDNKWDEKWTFSGDGITRQVSPNDNEQYSQEYQWTGSGWSSAGSTATAGKNSTKTGAKTGRAVDRYLLGQVGRDIGTKKLKDTTRGKPYKVNLYQDDGHSSVNRAKVDLDRDDKWDEKWTFKGDTVQRKVAPEDDEQYTRTLHWTGSGWE